METTGRYLKNCKGCKKEFRTDARGQRFGPPEVCKCAERRAKQRNKRARERRAYARNPEQFKALSRTRAEARRLVLAFHGVTVKSDGKISLEDGYETLGCNSPGCTVNFAAEYEVEIERRTNKGQSIRGARHAAMKRLLKKLEAHHRNHNPFDNRIGYSYPETSNVELLCRTHHEQSDRAKAGKAQLELWRPRPSVTWITFLFIARLAVPRFYYQVPVSKKWRLWIDKSPGMHRDQLLSLMEHSI